jgi:hypothetical protein
MRVVLVDNRYWDKSERFFLSFVLHFEINLLDDTCPIFIGTFSRLGGKGGSEGWRSARKVGRSVKGLVFVRTRLLPR